MSEKTVCIVQARMGSTRLPRKSLMPLGRSTLLQNILERIKLAEKLDEIVVATTRKTEDDPIVELARSMEIKVYRGHETDLVDRYYHAALESEATVVVRIPADNPLIHPDEVDKIVAYFLENKDSLDFASNLAPYLGNNYPDGLGAEIFSFQVLKELNRDLKDPYHREHVTSIFIAEPDRWRTGTIPCEPDYSRPDIILDINTPEDYAHIKKLYDDLQTSQRLIHIRDIIPWYRENPREKFTRK